MVYHHGTWGMSSGETDSGIFLGLVWVVEAGAIFWMAMLVAYFSQTAAPFCEACNAWCTGGMPIRSLGVCGGDTLKEHMEAKDWAFFDQLGSPGSQRWILINHHGCPSCGKFHTLSAEAVGISRDSRGRETVKKQTLVNNLLVGPEDLEIIRSSRIDPASGWAIDRAAAALENLRNCRRKSRSPTNIDDAKPEFLPVVEQSIRETTPNDSGGRIGI